MQKKQTNTDEQGLKFQVYYLNVRTFPIHTVFL